MLMSESDEVIYSNVKNGAQANNVSTGNTKRKGRMNLKGNVLII